MPGPMPTYRPSFPDEVVQRAQQFPAWGFPLEKTLFLISHFANPSRIMLA